MLEAFNARFGALIHEGYGLTETSPVASFNHVGKEPRPGTIGQPIWGVDVEIARAEVHDAIELLPRGELGELVVRGHLLFSGYLNRPEATAEAVVDGWFRTGDLGTKDADDYVTIVDRKKDMILRNGYNVYPREVEEALITHPDIVNVAVFGIHDDKHGQEIAAAVTLVAGKHADRARRSVRTGNRGWPPTSTRAASRSSPSSRWAPAARSSSASSSPGTRSPERRRPGHLIPTTRSVRDAFSRARPCPG